MSVGGVCGREKGKERGKGRGRGKRTRAEGEGGRDPQDTKRAEKIMRFSHRQEGERMLRSHPAQRDWRESALPGPPAGLDVSSNGQVPQNARVEREERGRNSGRRWRHALGCVRACPP